MFERQGFGDGRRGAVGEMMGVEGPESGECILGNEGLH